MVYLPSKQHIANLLTKSLPRKLFEELTGKLGMIIIYLPAWRGSVVEYNML